MASAYGIVHNYGEPQSNFDPQLAAGVLQYKQQKYDANLMKVEQTLAQLGMSASMMHRDEDKEYFKERISTLVNSIPKLGEVDYSSSASTRAILSQVNQALDEKVIKDLADSKRLRDFSQVVEQAKEDGTYADLNYQDALKNANYEQYMQGGELGKLSYTPYVDYDAELLKKIKGTKEVIGEYIQDVDENGEPVRIKVSDMTIAQWEDRIPGLITPQMKAQMQVEGRAMYGWSDEQAQAASKESINESISQIDTKINQYESILSKNNISDSYRERTEKDLASWKKKKEKLQDYDFNSVTASSLGFKLVYDAKIKELAATVGVDPSKTFLDPKGTGSKNTRTESKEINQKLKDIGGTFDTVGLKNQPDITEETLTNRSLALQDQLTPYVNIGIQEAKNTSKDVFDYDKTYKSYIDSGYTKEEAEKESVFDYYEATKNDVLLAQGKEIERQLDMLNEVKQKAHDSTFVKMTKEVSDGIFEASYEEVAANRTMVVKEDGTEISSRDYLDELGIDTKEKFNKFVSEGSPESKQFLSNIYLDFVLSSTNMNWSGASTSIASALNANGRVSRISKEDLHNVERFLKAGGFDEKDFNDLFDVYEGKGVVEGLAGEAVNYSVKRVLNLPATFDFTGRNNNFRKLSDREVYDLANEEKITSDTFISLKKDIDPKLKKLIEGRLKYSYKVRATSSLGGGLIALAAEKASNLVDTNFYDDKFIRNNLAYDSEQYKKNYTKSVQEAVRGVLTPKALVINAAVTAKSEEASKSIEELRNAAQTKGMVLDANLPTNVMVNPLNSDEVIISQTLQKTDFNDKGELENFTAPNQVSISKSNFQNLAPTIYEMADFSKQAGELTFSSEMNEEVTLKGYRNASDVEYINKTTQFFQNPNLTNAAFDVTAKNMLRTSFKSLIQQQPEIEALTEMAIDNAHKFKVKLKSDRDGNAYAEISVTEDNTPTSSSKYKLLHSYQIPTDQLQTATKVFDVTPQVFLTNTLQQVYQQYMFSGLQDISKDKKLNLLVNSLF